MNMFEGDTAALLAMDGDAQGDRLLRLRFPNADGPADTLMLANSLHAEESLSRDFRYQVEVLSDDATIDLSRIMGKMVTIELVREDGSLRYFNGYVFEFSFVKTDGGFAFYDMVLGPWLGWLHLRQNNVAFHNVSVSDLSEQVFEHYLTRDWKTAITGPDPVITYLCQHNESDHNLLHRHWEKAGWFYFYEHRADGHTLHLRDDSTMTAPIDGAITSMPFQHHAGAMEDDGMHHWSAVRRAGAGKTTLASFNFKYPRVIRRDRDSLDQRGDVASLEVYENVGTYGFKGSDEGDELAQRRMEERDARGQQFEASGNDRTAQPGRWFTLTGHFDDSVARRAYLIVAVSHHASNNYQAGARAGQGAVSQYRNTCSCIDRDVPWRPGRGYSSVRPAIHGAQTAVVVGPSGEEIYTDAWGRVKVQFHWDRLGAFDDQSSAWIRVMSGWAGANFGQVSVPRIGMEVVINFLDGDIDRPLIVGCLYNANNMPPWELPTNKTQSGILSRSTKSGQTTNANALRFEDKKGKEQLWLHAEKDQLTEVENDETKWVGNDRHKTVDHDETSAIKHDRTETVGHDEKLTVGNDRSEHIGRHEHITISGNRTEHVGQNDTVHIDGARAELVMLAKAEVITLGKELGVGLVYDITVGQDLNTNVGKCQLTTVADEKVTLVGHHYHIEAGDSFSIKVGEASLYIGKDGAIALKGSQIDIAASGPVRVNGKDVDVN